MDNGASSYRRFLDGDDDGMVEIIRDYKDGLILYLNGFVGNIYIAEEMAEEVFVKLVVKRPKFSQRSSFKTWFYAIGRHIAIDHLRRNAKKTALSIEEHSRMLCDEENLEHAYIREEEKITVHHALKRLPSQYRQILYLIYFEGFDNSQAAAIMKKSNRQIENLIYRAKTSLKSILEKEGFRYEELS